MGLPQPYKDADDEVVVEGFLRGDDEAVAALAARHGALAELAIRRETGAGSRDDPEPLAAFLAFLRTEGEPALRTWSPQGATLRAFLGALARRSTRSSHAGTRVALLVPRPPTPPALDVAAIEEEEATLALARAARECLARQPPNVTALVRMRLRGLEVPSVAALVGSTPAQVEGALERVAARLATLDPPRAAEDELLWRALLFVLPPTDRVRLAIRTEHEPALAARRTRLEAVFRQIEGATLATEPPPHAADLGVAGIAGFVDGTMRGAARARAESQVIASPRALDEVAALAVDLRALPLARESSWLERPVLVAAMSLATGLVECGAELADRALDLTEAPVAGALARVGRASRLLASGAAPSRDVSGVLARDVPADDEVAVVAFESLALGDPGTALRAVDEAGAQAPVAARLRMLAASASGEGELARTWAEGVHEGYDVDPGAALDARIVLSLERGETLPREVLVERLRTLLPDLVRATLAQHAHIPSTFPESR